MNVSKITLFALLAASLAMPAACSTTPTSTQKLEATSQQLAITNLTLSNKDSNGPTAQLTPEGGLLIAAESVSLTPQQQAETLSYRKQLDQINQQAIAVSKRGVNVGMRASVPAVIGALFGESDAKIEQNMHKRLAGVFADAAKICDRLPAVMATQQQLAASLPAFAPYANLTPAKIDDCRKSARDYQNHRDSTSQVNR